MTIRVALLLSLCLWSPALAGSFNNGNELHTRCSENGFAEGYCFGYIAGISDVLSNAAIGDFNACQPKDVTVQQVVDVVKKYLKENPQDRHFTANSLVAYALSEAFPC